MYRELYALWRARDGRDEFLGTLINAWLDRGGEARASAPDASYVDVGTLHGYRAATTLLLHRAPGATTDAENISAAR